MTELAQIDSQKRLIVEAISKRWGLGYQSMDRDYGVSFALLRGSEAVAWIEVAITEMPIESITEVAIPIRIWNNAQTLVMFTGRPFFLALRTANGGFVADFRSVEKSNFQIVRSDDDTESFIKVPGNLFLEFITHHAAMKP